MKILPETLMEEAKVARGNAYCPYSGYAVGAALLCEDGTIVKGCNVENGAYGPTNCAERTAVFAAVAQGKRSFLAIAIAGGPVEEPPVTCYPCGTCRQVLSEFCDRDFPVFIKNETGEIQSIPLSDLLPKSFHV